MTVMPSSAEVADKAVSTDDGGSGVEVSRLEAYLAALVEAKVEAMKASSNLSKRSGSAPASPHRLRLTSTSTASSSQNQHHHQHHHDQQNPYRRKSHHHHHHHYPHYDQQDLHRHRKKRHDSAPCGDYIEDLASHQHKPYHHGKGRRRASENPRSSPKKKRRHSKSPHLLQSVVPDMHPVGVDSRFELLGIDGDHDPALINYERTREALSDTCEYPALHQSACYFSQSTAQLKIHYDDDDDYLTLHVADEMEEEMMGRPGKAVASRERYHRPRRKRKRRKQRIDPIEDQEEEIPDPEELPPRARWTIVATACLLLAMSLLLVGVTLRMAPIIDDMVRKENEQLLNSLNRDSSVPTNFTASP
ncbi:uncharacterized protein [Prorops nasuta]|uniref:uncharacterized protein isoform X2 n=1 Tax=Prorops nasuta TaxID=863751 RepID=UPI0034CD17B2